MYELGQKRRRAAAAPVGLGVLERRLQRDQPQQTVADHTLDARVLAAIARSRGSKSAPSVAAPLDQALVVHDPHRRRDGGGGDRVTAERRGRRPPATVDHVDHALGQHQRTGRRGAAGESLAHGHHVRTGAARWKAKPWPKRPNPVTVSSAIQSAAGVGGRRGQRVLVLRRGADAALAVVHHDGGGARQRFAGRPGEAGDVAVVAGARPARVRTAARAAVARRPWAEATSPPWRLTRREAGRPQRVHADRPGRAPRCRGRRARGRRSGCGPVSSCDSTKRQIDGLAGRDEEGDALGPLLAGETDLQQIRGGLVTRPVAGAVIDIHRVGWRARWRRTPRGWQCPMRHELSEPASINDAPIGEGQLRPAGRG